MTATILNFTRDPRYMTRYGEAIRERREYVGYPTATALADESHRLAQREPERFHSFSQQSLSRWERDQSGDKIESAHGKSLRTLAYLLKWKSSEFEMHVGVPIGRVPDLDPEVRGSDTESDTPPPPGRLLGKLVSLPLYGSVSAGVSGLTSASGEEMLVTDHYDLSTDFLDGANPLDCHLMEVTGDSMTCENVRKTIPEGAKVIVNTAIKPSAGDVVVADIEVDGSRVAILKVYREQDRGVVLDSYNMDHERIFLTQSMEPRIIGVVMNYVPPGRRALRRMMSRRFLS